MVICFNTRTLSMTLTAFLSVFVPCMFMYNAIFALFCSQIYTTRFTQFKINLGFLNSYFLKQHRTIEFVLLLKYVSPIARINFWVKPVSKPVKSCLFLYSICLTRYYIVLFCQVYLATWVELCQYRYILFLIFVCTS